MAEPAPPRYFQVKLALADLIAGLDRGTSLPPERQLAEQLGTSRTTLRKALAELAGEGVLRRTQGSGNFVAPPKVVHVRQLSSLTDDLKADTIYTLVFRHMLPKKNRAIKTELQWKYAIALIGSDDVYVYKVLPAWKKIEELDFPEKDQGVEN